MPARQYSADEWWRRQDGGTAGATAATGGRQQCESCWVWVQSVCVLHFCWHRSENCCEAGHPTDAAELQGISYGAWLRAATAAPLICPGLLLSQAPSRLHFQGWHCSTSAGSSQRLRVSAGSRHLRGGSSEGRQLPARQEGGLSHAAGAWLGTLVPAAPLLAVRQCLFQVRTSQGWPVELWAGSFEPEHDRAWTAMKLASLHQQACETLGDPGRRCMSARAHARSEWRKARAYLAACPALVVHTPKGGVVCEVVREVFGHKAEVNSV